MQNDFGRAMEFRHACRLFRTDAVLTDNEIEFILQAGRLSPSSMGLEHWYFIVVTDSALKSGLQKASRDQSQIGTCSVLIVILAKKADLKPDSPYVQSMLLRNSSNPAEMASLRQMYAELAATSDLVAWSIAQCHLAAANMMTAAASLGIDSCPVGGFDVDAVSTVLGLDRERFEPALLLPLGRRAHEASPRHRLSIADLVERR